MTQEWVQQPAGSKLPTNDFFEMVEVKRGINPYPALPRKTWIIIYVYLQKEFQRRAEGKSREELVLWYPLPPNPHIQTHERIHHQ